MTASPTGQITWRQDESVAHVTLSNEGHLNAITVAMWTQLRECMQAIAAQSSVRVVVIRGSEGAFAAGADIEEFQTQRITRDQARHYHLDLIAPALRSIAHCPVPVVAAIDGPCVGGGLEIASLCDLRIASDRSRFGVPIAKLGFPMAPHEAAGLVRLVGPAVAAELLLEGRIVDAQEAYQKGIVQRVVPLSQWEYEVAQSVARIRAGAPLAARMNKRLIHLFTAIDDGAVLSPAQMEACWDFANTQDYRRGIRAFLDKTTPDFEDN